MSQIQNPNQIDKEKYKYEFVYKGTTGKGKRSIYQYTVKPNDDIVDVLRKAIELSVDYGAVVRILGIRTIGFGKSIHATIINGAPRFEIVLGFRTGLNVPNALSVELSDILPLKRLVNELEQIVNKASDILTSATFTGLEEE